MQFPDSDFWNFSVNFYPLSNVEQCCLELQDKHGLNVNLVLFCYWLAAEKQQLLNPEHCQSLINISQQWQDIITPLRQSRQLIKHTPMALTEMARKETRNNISKIELNMEHMHQLSLEQSWMNMKIESSNESLENISIHNIRLYLDTVNLEMTTDTINTKFQPLLKACHKYLKKQQKVAL